MLIAMDTRKRVPIGKLLRGIATNLFNAQVVDGKIILEPMRAIPERETWLFENTEALRSVKKGLKDAQSRKVRKFDPDKG